MNNTTTPTAICRTMAGETVTVRPDAHVRSHYEATCGGCGWTYGYCDTADVENEANNHALRCTRVSPDHWPGMQQAQGR